MIEIVCPKCHSQRVRSSPARSWWERLGRFLGLYQIRCEDCSARFSREIWDLLNAAFARCKRCYGLDLSSFAPADYNLSALDRIALKLGAKAHRCAACRHNFVSFRFRKANPVRSRPKDLKRPKEPLNRHVSGPAAPAMLP